MLGKIPSVVSLDCSVRHTFTIQLIILSNLLLYTYMRKNPTRNFL
nr:MAG TPA: hypothetical protein [Caudoviricetes sp.]